MAPTKILHTDKKKFFLFNLNQTWSDCITHGFGQDWTEFFFISMQNFSRTPVLLPLKLLVFVCASSIHKFELLLCLYGK